MPKVVVDALALLAQELLQPSAIKVTSRDAEMPHHSALLGVAGVRGQLHVGIMLCTNWCVSSRCWHEVNMR
jgi:hypothetical protein